MKVILVVLALCMYAVAGQGLPETVPVTSPLCTATGTQYVTIDKSSFYAATFSGVSRLCVKDYLDACATPRGLEPCNRETSRCVPVGYTWNDAVQYPSVAAVMVARPEFCTSSLAVRSSTTSVILIAQIIISSIVLVSAFIVFAVLAQCSAVIKVILVLYLIPCVILLFSYYYLNAFVILTTTFAAAACHGFRTDRGFVLFCAFLFLGFFWVTYSDGLGYAQHHGRFTPGAAAFGFQSQLCDNYYDGFFSWPLDAHGDNQNLALLYRGMCSQEWLAAELFFMILVEQFMVPFIAIGAVLHFRNRKESGSKKSKE